MDNFHIVEQLGEGTYGRVYRVVDVRDECEYALKICNVDQDVMPAILTECLILTELSNDDYPNIVTCLEIMFDKNKILIKMPLLTSDLGTMLKKYTFKEKRIRKVMRDILNGVKYLHGKGIIHCDLKPANILYDVEYNMFEVADFNSAQIGDLNETAGCTRWYRPPEAFFDADYTKESDIWSIGCIFYQVLTGKVLFPSSNSKEHVDMIIKRFGIPDDYEPMSEYEFVKVPKGLSSIKDDDARDLLEKMLCINPEKRISVQEALEHPYF